MAPPWAFLETTSTCWSRVRRLHACQPDFPAESFAQISAVGTTCPSIADRSTSTSACSTRIHADNLTVIWLDRVEMPIMNDHAEEGSLWLEIGKVRVCGRVISQKFAQVDHIVPGAFAEICANDSRRKIWIGMRAAAARDQHVEVVSERKPRRRRHWYLLKVGCSLPRASRIRRRYDCRPARFARRSPWGRRG